NLKKEYVKSALLQATQSIPGLQKNHFLDLLEYLNDIGEYRNFLVRTLSEQPRVENFIQWVKDAYQTSVRYELDLFFAATCLLPFSVDVFEKMYGTFPLQIKNGVLPSYPLYHFTRE